MKKLALFVVIIVAISAAAIYTLPQTLTSLAQRTLSETLQTNVTIEGLTLSVTEGSFKVKELEIQDYPEFSNDEFFVLKNLVFIVDPISLMTKTIVIEELSVEDIDLKLTGSINHNSLKHLISILKANDEKAKKVEQEHQAAALATGTEHKHEHPELKLKLQNLNIYNIDLTAHITKPIKLDAKTLAITGINVQNIGGENGINVNDITKDIVSSVDKAVQEKIISEVPAQKVYEDTKQVIEDGLEKGKLKADELMKKYF